jgi:glycosyltransferase involved in cell wall biosynthesis
MTQKTLVSIVMPVYNPNLSYLAKSVASILAQTHDNIEFIIVIDSAGTDNDANVLDTLNQFHDDHRMKLFVNDKRANFTCSLNRGLSYAQGEFIARMDCDDVSSPNRIAEQLNFLSDEDLDITGCWVQEINGEGQVLDCFSPPSQWSELRKYLLFHNPFVHSSILFRRKILETIGPYRTDFELAEDYEFYLRAFSMGFVGANVPKYIHSLRRHGASMSYSKWKALRIAYLRCKFAGVFDYHFNKPRDIFFLGITPLTIFVTPSNVLMFKKIFSASSKKPANISGD